MIRLGVVGYGLRSTLMVKTFRKADPDVRVVAVVDPDEAGVRARLEEIDKSDVVFYKNLKDMIMRANLDGLFIATRCNLHTPYAIEASKYNVPIFLEKPVATSMNQVLSLEKAFLKFKSQVVVGFPLRITPICTLTKKLIEEGAVGTPQHILGVNYVPYGTVYFDEMYRNYEVTQGLFLQKATHDFDYMSFLMGSPIVRVCAMKTCGRVFGGKKKANMKCSQCREANTCLESPKNRIRNCSSSQLKDHWCTFGRDCGSPQTGMNEDSSSALLEFASGVHGVYTQVFFTRRDALVRGSTISGYHGTVSFDWYKNEIIRVRHHAPFSDTIKAGGEAEHFGGDTELAHDFVNIMRGKGKSRTPISTGLASVYSCLAAKESAEKGKFIKVRQVGQF